MDDQGIRILVVDGEGSPNIGVVSPLEVLDEMMSRIAFDNDTAEESILPCDHFDLIVGSGDGGWIALMLGRLGMSISRAKAAYQEIHSFIHHNCASLEPTAKAEILEVRLKKLICEQTGEQDPDLEKLQEPKSTKPRCKVAVLTKASLNIGAPVVLRTYRVRDNKTINCPIWAAMRACTARPNVFPEVLLSGQNLISASLGHNNPVDIAMHEVLAAFPNSRVDCIVSLGSGHPGHSEVQTASSNSLANAAMALAQGSEIVSQEFSKRQHTEGRGDIYFRFNVQQGLQAYVQAGYDAALSHTRAYLQDPAVGDALNAAIRALRGERQRGLSVHQSPPTPENASSGIIHASNAPPIQTYVYALYEEGFGLPLWDPQPLYEAKPVEIGDVGFLTKLGAFQVLFNATLPAESQTTMGYRIPPDFEPISIHSSDLGLDPDVLQVPFLYHGDVLPSGHGLDNVSTRQSKTQKPFKLTFAAMNGAALVIKDPPTEIALTPERKIEEYIRNNCRSWYHYYEHDPQGPRRNLRGSSLIFVTATIQNSQWALGAWSSIGNAIEISYSGSATTSNGRFVDIDGLWAPPGRRDVKQGPTSTRGAVRPKLREQNALETLASQTQTLFLRGYVIGVRDTRPETLEPSKVYPLPYSSWWDMLRTIFSYGIPAILRAASGPRDLPPPPPPPPAAPALPVEESSDEEGSITVETQELSSGRLLRHPADDIMDEMFKTDPSIHTIILHDDTIAELIRHTRPLQVENPKHVLTYGFEPATFKSFKESHAKCQDPPCKKVTMSSLPDDLLLYFFSMCDARAISQLRQCCKMFYELSHTRIVWLEVLRTTCGELNIAVPPFQENARTSSSLELLATTWIRFQNVLRNAKDGKPPPHKIVRSIKLTNSVFGVEQSSDGQFLFTIDTSGMRVWNLLSPQPTLVASFKIEIPEEDSWNTITAYMETNTSFLVYLGIIAPSQRVNQWLAFRFQAPSLEFGEYQLSLLSRLDRFPFSAKKWCGWTAIPTVPFMTTCFQHSSEGKYYVLWNPLSDTCARWAADARDTFTELCIFTISDFIVVLDEASQEIFVYARPEIPPKSSYAPKPFAQVSNPALLHIPAETSIMHEPNGSVMYWKTFPNRGHQVSNYEGLSFIYDTEDENWLQERFEIYRADSSSSAFTPLPLKCDRSRCQYAYPLPFDTGFVARTDISIDQSALLHTPSGNFTKVAFHLSASPKENGGIELGRGILYDSDGAFQFGVGDYSICPFTGRMCIATPEGIEIIDFVESLYLQDIPTVQLTGKHLPISEVFHDHPGRSRRSSFSISNKPNESLNRTRRNSVS